MSEGESERQPPSSKKKASDDEILRQLAAVDDPVAKTSEIAEDLPIQQQTTKRRLDKLERDGYVGSKKVGRGRVWWLSNGSADVDVAFAPTEELRRRVSILEERVDDLEDQSGGLFR